MCVAQWCWSAPVHVGACPCGRVKLKIPLTRSRTATFDRPSLRRKTPSTSGAYERQRAKALLGARCRFSYSAYVRYTIPTRALSGRTAPRSSAPSGAARRPRPWCGAGIAQKSWSWDAILTHESLLKSEEGLDTKLRKRLATFRSGSQPADLEPFQNLSTNGQLDQT